MEYLYRLICGWKFLHGLLSDKNNPDFIKSKLTLIFGNHSYDVSAQEEAELIAKYFKKDGYIGRSDSTLEGISNGKLKYYSELTSSQIKLEPRLTPGLSKDINVVYVDIDPTMLTCSDYLVKQDGDNLRPYLNSGELKKDIENFTKFKKCLNDRYFSAYPEEEWLTNLKINNYIRYLQDTLIVLSKIDDLGQCDWRIVRMHQPIFNNDFDFVGMKLNNLLMQAFQDAGIHMYFVSHNHSGQIDLALYEDGDYSYQFTDYYIPGVSPQRKGEPKKSIKNNDDVREECVGEEDPFYDENGQIDPSKKKSPTCINRAQLWLKDYKVVDGIPHGKISINQYNSDLILQIVAGNGGRAMDALFSDKFSDGLVLWGYTGYKRNGYVIANFVNKKSDDGNKINKKCILTFYALDNDDDKAKMKPVFILKVKQLDEDIDNRKDLLNESFKVDIVEKLKRKNISPAQSS